MMQITLCYIIRSSHCAAAIHVQLDAANQLFGGPMDVDTTLATLERATQLIRDAALIDSPPRRRSTMHDESASKLIRFMTQCDHELNPSDPIDRVTQCREDRQDRADRDY